MLIEPFRITLQRVVLALGDVSFGQRTMAPVFHLKQNVSEYEYRRCLFAHNIYKVHTNKRIIRRVDYTNSACL